MRVAPEGEQTDEASLGCEELNQEARALGACCFCAAMA
jgi:hypothetical protein